MKKVKMILASTAVVFFLGASAATTFANNSMNANIVLQDAVQSDAQVENLPDEVTNAIAESKWKDWTISKATIETKDDATYYIVTLIKGDETKKVKVTPEGKIKE